MTPFSGLGIGLSLVFGFLLLALVAELYYLLWWKKRIINDTESSEEDDYSSNHAKEFFYLLCWRRRPSSVHNNSNSSSSRDPDANEPDMELGSGKDVLLKAFGEEGVESELMRLHNLAGPPRFLFTIKEETKEDLETESVKSRTRSLSDLIMAVDNTPFLTPLASPMKSSPNLGSNYNHHHGFNFNPLFESSSDAADPDLSKLISSPPPKFKFLRDAEEKLYRRLKEEAEKRVVSKNGGGSGSLQDCGAQAHHHHHQPLPQYPASSSQVLPLASSPPTFRPVLDQIKPIVH